MRIISLTLIAAGLIVATQAFAAASHFVRGHVKKNGTRVVPHQATNRDGTKQNNWSHKNNVNPHTGKKGTKD